MSHRQLSPSVGDDELPDYPYYAMALQAFAMGLPEFDEEAFDAGTSIRLLLSGTAASATITPLSAEEAWAIDRAFSPFRRTAHPPTAFFSFDDLLSELSASAATAPEGHTPATHTTSSSIHPINSCAAPQGPDFTSAAVHIQAAPQLHASGSINSNRATSSFRRPCKATPGPTPLRTVQTVESTLSSQPRSKNTTRRSKTMAKYHDCFAAVAAEMALNEEVFEKSDEPLAASSERLPSIKQSESDPAEIGKKRKRGLGKKTIAAQATATAKADKDETASSRSSANQRKV